MTKVKEQGLSLLDIAPLTETVDVGGGQMLAVHGVSAEDVLGIFQRFPDTQKWISAGGMKPADMVNLAPNAISAIIAAANGHPGEVEYEKAAAHIPLEAQLDVFEKITSLTFRSGFGPFVLRIANLIVAARSGSYGRATDTSLQKPLNTSSPAATPQGSSGP